MSLKNKKSKIGLILITVLQLITGCMANTETNTLIAEAEASATSVSSREINIEYYKSLLSCNFYNEQSFNSYVNDAFEYETDKKITSGVIPHHLLAGNMIAGFFKTASENRTRKIDTVVIIAPMHEANKNMLVTTLSDWNTPYGILENEVAFSEKMEIELGAVTDDKMMAADHSISSHIPFVKYYFPDATVSCLMIAAGADRSTPDEVSVLLSEMAKEKDCLFLFSVDFSHYLSPQETDIHDEETLEVITNNNLARIAEMNDSNMDSPHCIGTFLRLNTLSGVETVLLDHSNSLRLSGLPQTNEAFSAGLTSYFIFAGE